MARSQRRKFMGSRKKNQRNNKRLRINSKKRRKNRNKNILSRKFRKRYQRGGSNVEGAALLSDANASRQAIITAGGPSGGPGGGPGSRRRGFIIKVRNFGKQAADKIVSTSVVGLILAQQGTADTINFVKNIGRNVRRYVFPISRNYIIQHDDPDIIRYIDGDEQFYLEVDYVITNLVNRLSPISVESEYQIYKIKYSRIKSPTPIFEFDFNTLNGVCSEDFDKISGDDVTYENELFVFDENKEDRGANKMPVIPLREGALTNPFILGEGNFGKVQIGFKNLKPDAKNPTNPTKQLCAIKQQIQQEPSHGEERDPKNILLNKIAKESAEIEYDLFEKLEKDSHPHPHPHLVKSYIGSGNIIKALPIEYFGTDLNSWLRHGTTKDDKSLGIPYYLSYKMVLKFLEDIHAGITFLHSKNISHFDLAARNILIAPLQELILDEEKESDSNLFREILDNDGIPNYLLKITDLGLGRDMAKQPNPHTIFPLRWTYPFYEMVFTDGWKKCDMWSLLCIGIEMLGRGEIPYKETPVIKEIWIPASIQVNTIDQTNTIKEWETLVDKLITPIYKYNNFVNINKSELIKLICTKFEITNDTVTIEDIKEIFYFLIHGLETELDVTLKNKCVLPFPKTDYKDTPHPFCVQLGDSLFPCIKNGDVPYLPVEPNIFVSPGDVEKVILLAEYEIPIPVGIDGNSEKKKYGIAEKNGYGILKYKLSKDKKTDTYVTKQIENHYHYTEPFKQNIPKILVDDVEVFVGLETSRAKNNNYGFLPTKETKYKVTSDPAKPTNKMYLLEPEVLPGSDAVAPPGSDAVAPSRSDPDLEKYMFQISDNKYAVIEKNTDDKLNLETSLKLGDTISITTDLQNSSVIPDLTSSGEEGNVDPDLGDFPSGEQPSTEFEVIKTFDEGASTEPSEETLESLRSNLLKEAKKIIVNKPDQLTVEIYDNLSHDDLITTVLSGGSRIKKSKKRNNKRHYIKKSLKQKGGSIPQPKYDKLSNEISKIILSRILKKPPNFNNNQSTIYLRENLREHTEESIYSINYLKLLKEYIEDGKINGVEIEDPALADFYLETETIKLLQPIITKLIKKLKPTSNDNNDEGSIMNHDKEVQEVRVKQIEALLGLN